MIEHALVITNPFDDIVARISTKPIQQTQKPALVKQSVPVKNKNLISFDDGDGEDCEPF
jgi:hypothetical protein